MHLLFTSNRVWKKNMNARISYAVMIKLQLKVGQECHFFTHYVNPSVNGCIYSMTCVISVTLASLVELFLASGGIGGGGVGVMDMPKGRKVFTIGCESCLFHIKMGRKLKCY